MPRTLASTLHTSLSGRPPGEVSVDSSVDVVINEQLVLALICNKVRHRHHKIIVIIII